EVDVRGVTVRAWKNAPPNLRAIFEISKAHGDNDFIVYEDERWTFARHYDAVASVARWLIEEAGVRKGDRVAVAMRNFPEWSVGFWAAACAGAIVVPLNAWWTGEELAYGLRDSGTKVVFADAERLERIEPNLASLPVEHMVVAKGEAAGDVVAFDSLVGAAGDLP